MKDKDKARDLLKQLLQGKADPAAVVDQLQRLNPHAVMVSVMTYADEPGIYTVGDSTGLTEAEMKEATKGKFPFIVTIHRCGPPIAHCERDVVM